MYTRYDKMIGLATGFSVVNMNEVTEVLRDTALIIMAGFVGGIAGKSVGGSLAHQLGVVLGLFAVVLPSVFIVYWATRRLDEHRKG